MQIAQKIEILANFHVSFNWLSDILISDLFPKFRFLHSLHICGQFEHFGDLFEAILANALVNFRFLIANPGPEGAIWRRRRQNGAEGDRVGLFG